MSLDNNAEENKDDERKEAVEEEDCKEVILDKRYKDKDFTACSQEMNDRATSQNAVVQPLLTGG